MFDHTLGMVVRCASNEIAELLRLAWQSGAPEIDKPLPDLVVGKPVNGLLKRSAGRFTGYFASRKMQMGIPWYGTLERDLMIRLECSLAVRAFYRRPMTIALPLADRVVKHTPGFLVRGDDGWTVVEAVDARHMGKAPIAETARAAERFFQALELGYRRLPETAIRAQPALANARWLLRYRRHEMAPNVVMTVRSRLAGGAALRLSELTALAGGEDTVYTLMLHGLLQQVGAAPLPGDVLLRLYRPTVNLSPA